MSYFSHAYRKSFVGTKATQASAPGVSAGVDDGFLLDAGLSTAVLADTLAPNALGVGTYGFFTPDTYLSVNNASAAVIAGKPLVFAAASLFTNDMIGPFHGGYKESNKSKMINPRFVHKFSKMTGAASEQSIWHVGNTNLNLNSIATLGAIVPGTGYTNGVYLNVSLTGGSGVGATADITVAGGVVTVITLVHPGQGYLVGDILGLPASIPYVAGTLASTSVATTQYNINTPCSFDFLCGETYNLRFDLWGSPVLRFLNHDLYKTLAASTGCCASGAIVPTNVDSTLVMIDWANQIVNDLWLQNFIQPIVYTETGSPLFQTAAQAVAAGYLTPLSTIGAAAGSANVWSNYGAAGAVGATVPPVGGHIPGALAGIRFVTAYADTQFSNCSFQNTDFYEKEIVQMNVSLTDLSGDPCEFSALCTTKEYEGFTGQGFGETVLRDVILDESYLQNHFSNDVRIREITQGDQYFAAVTRNALFTRYVIQHSVPRYNNPSGVYDNDQYALNIYIPATAGAATAFETFMATWLGAVAVGGVVTLQTYGHTPFVPAVI